MMETLFDLDDYKQDSPRLILLKRHDIQTHHNPDCPEPWVSIPMNAARNFARDEGDTENYEGLVEICASLAIALEDAGLIFYGDSKEEVEDDAIHFMETRKNEP